MTESIDWNDRYREGDLPWDTGRPSSELQRVLARHSISPCRVLEIGCGTGTNSLWLAQQGFDVTGIDLAPLAIEQANKRAHAAGAKATFVVADILDLPSMDLPNLGGPFSFFFDRGCYHAVRRQAASEYVAAVARQIGADGRGLVLAGNAREPHEPGPPVVTEAEIRAELGQAFRIVDLQEFRFDEAPGTTQQFLGWSCLVEKR